MAISRVQATGTQTASSSTTSCAFVSNVTAGSLIVVVVSNYAYASAFTASSCAKSAGTATIGTVALDRTSHITGGTPEQCAVWSAIVTGSGSLTMQVTGSAGNYWGIGIAEFSGSWDASRTEGVNGATWGAGTGGTSRDTGNVTSAGGAVFVAGVAWDHGSTQTVTPDAAFTQIYEQEDAAAYTGHNSISRIVSSGTTDSGTWAFTSTPGGNSAAALAVYKESGAAAATSLVIPSRAAIQSILTR